MRQFHRNQYEQAFENWLIDNRIQYIAVDEHKKAAFERCKIKSFDFLVFPRGGRTVIAEVKGRKFKGTSLARLAGLECWVTAEDVDGLANWQNIFGADHQAVLVFAYDVENIDVDLNGRDVFEFGATRYVFFCVRLDDYGRYMKRRSPKWQTVTLPADKFRQCAIEIGQLLF